MTDYTHYNPGLDPEWEEFAKTFTIPPLPKDLALAKEIFNKNRATLFKEVLGPVDGLTTKDVSIPTRDGNHIRGRLYFPVVKTSPVRPLPLYVYSHGGGYLFGNLETEDMHCRLLAVNVPCVVLNVDYRLSPEWTFPTPFTDVFDAVDWILDPERLGEYDFDPKNVILGGVSAGGTLSLAAAVREIEQGTKRVTGLNISIPSTVHPSRFPRHLVKDGYTSFEQNEHAPLLSTARLEYLHDLQNEDPESPILSTLLRPDSTLQQFPPIAFHLCGADPVRDGGLLLEEKLRKLGVQTRLEVYTGWPHAFWNLPQLKKSASYRDRMIEDAKWLCSASV